MNLAEVWNYRYNIQLSIVDLKKIYPTSIKGLVIPKASKNGSHTSKQEDEIYEILCTRYKEVKRQYKSELYPFPCDFYLVDKDIYIEFQGTWTHGPKPFENIPEDLKLLTKWENKYKLLHSSYYKKAIHTWTIRDPLKRKIAKENNLNWLEFFTIKDFKKWFYNF